MPSLILSLCLDQDPPEREARGEGAVLNRLPGLVGTEFLGEVADRGKRAGRPGRKAAWEPRGPWVSLTLCPQATVVLGPAVSWHVYLPAFQRPCHGARVPGLSGG